MRRDRTGQPPGPRSTEAGLRSRPIESKRVSFLRSLEHSAVGAWTDAGTSHHPLLAESVRPALTVGKPRQDRPPVVHPPFAADVALEQDGSFASQAPTRRQGELAQEKGCHPPQFLIVAAGDQATFFPASGSIRSSGTGSSLTSMPLASTRTAASSPRCHCIRCMPNRPRTSICRVSPASVSSARRNPMFRASRSSPAPTAQKPAMNRHTTRSVPPARVGWIRQVRRSGWTVSRTRPRPAAWAHGSLARLRQACCVERSHLGARTGTRGPGLLPDFGVHPTRRAEALTRLAPRML